MFRRSHVLTVVVALAIYAIVAHAFAFDLLTVRLPGYHPVAHRLSEVMILWTLLWSAWGWYLYFLAGPIRYRVGVVGIALVPLAIGIMLAAYKLWWHLQSGRVPHSDGLVLPTLSALLEVAKGACAGLALRFQADVWRKYPWHATKREDQRPAEQS